MDYKAYIRESFEMAAKNMKALSESDEMLRSFAAATETIVESYKKGGCLYIAGNGGSAADAQHISAELVGKLSRDRTPIRAFAMTVDTSFLTAVGNDYGYDFIFSRQVTGLMKSEDTFLAITTSGNSKNITNALEACRAVGAKSILLSGKDGGKSKAQNLADHYILAPGSTTANIQEAHIVTYHTLCFMIEKALVEAGVVHYA
ncbi:MAG: SIS domain-containing protein [Proteobacteria bacterium]|nr:MAG: SIS domain-containing protein [Pseudomonadota bacterium]